MIVVYRPFQLAVLSFVGWTLYGVFFGLHTYISAGYFGQSPPFKTVLAIWLICGYIWMFLTPLIIFFAERFFIRRGQIVRNLAIHFLAGTLISLFQLSIFVFAQQWLLGDLLKDSSFSTDFQKLIVGNFHVNLLIYWIVVGIWHLRQINRRYLERERESAQLALSTSQLETKLAEARLDALKMQLQPHFLFNTMNSISVLMREDVAAANQMLLRLSELLRATLKSGSANEITLREELGFLHSYLEIEQTRFQDRLKVKISADEELLDARVPNLILQPLVENAIRHAVAPRSEETLVEICAARKNGQLELIVRDDGAGIRQPGEASTGIGLVNTRERLEKLYGADQEFTITSAAPGSGVQATITIPFREMEL